MRVNRIGKGAAMPFVNELIPEGDKREIGTILGLMQQPVSLYMWTVDRDKNAYLIRTGQDRDNPDNVYFLLSLNRERYRIRVKQKITAHRGGDSYVYKFDYAVSDNGLAPSSDVKETLKGALSAFAGFYGTVKPIAVEFEF
jgi:hypothetical protein